MQYHQFQDEVRDVRPFPENVFLLIRILMFALRRTLRPRSTKRFQSEKYVFCLLPQKPNELLCTKASYKFLFFFLVRRNYADVSIMSGLVTTTEKTTSDVRLEVLMAVKMLYVGLLVCCAV